MRAAVYHSNQDIRIEEFPLPRIGSKELLVRVEACGICGSDVMEWYRKDKVPLVLGHEIGGVVVELGEGLRGYKEGDRISASHHVPCNTCHYCINGHHTVCDTLRRTNFDPGGFAEYLRLPAINVERGVYPIQDDISFEEATFIEPLACVLRAQRKTHLKSGQSVIVLGSGISGVLHITMARALGAGRVFCTDIDPYRLEFAGKLGADAAVNAEEFSPDILRELNEGRLADLVVVCTGAKSAVYQALESVERGGTIILFAPTSPCVTIPLSINELFWKNDITITTSYAGSPADHIMALEHIHNRTIPVKEMITHRLALKEIAFGFQLVSRARDSLKVIIEPQR